MPFALITTTNFIFCFLVRSSSTVILNHHPSLVRNDWSVLCSRTSLFVVQRPDCGGAMAAEQTGTETSHLSTCGSRGTPAERNSRTKESFHRIHQTTHDDWGGNRSSPSDQTQSRGVSKQIRWIDPSRPSSFDRPRPEHSSMANLVPRERSFSFQWSISFWIPNKSVRSLSYQSSSSACLHDQ